MSDAVLDNLALKFPCDKILGAVEVDVRIPRTSAVLSNEIPPLAHLEEIAPMCLNHISFSVGPLNAVLDGSPLLLLCPHPNSGHEGKHG